MVLPNLIFRGVAKKGDGLNLFLRKEFGFQGRKVGDDLLVARDAINTAASQRKALSVKPQIVLAAGKEHEIAAWMAAQVSGAFKGYQPPAPGKIYVPPDYGTLTELTRATNRLAVEPDNLVPIVLAEEVLTVMITRFQAKFATGVTLDAHYVQAWLSLTKLGLLAERFDPDKIVALIKDRNAFGGALPASLDYLSFLDALTRFSPYAFTLPIRRQDCAWHFQGAAMWVFHSSLTNGLLDKFSISLNPLAAESFLLGLHGLSNMGEPNIYRLLRLLVDGINRLIRYLNDPGNFADADGTVDFLRQVQGFSAVHLLFADLASGNSSTVAHNRISYTTSVLDKLANLRVQLGGIAIDESKAFVGFASLSQRDELLRIVKLRCGQLAYDELSDTLCEVVTRCYDNLHAHLSKQAADAAASEDARLDRLWMQRNLRHGTFLRKNQFEKLFLESDGTVPATFGTLPYLLVLGLILDPASFLAFKPAIVQ